MRKMNLSKNVVLTFGSRRSHFVITYPNINDLIEMIKDLGLSQRRAKALIKMSDDYINKDWKADPTQLYGVGKYASDAYRIFCRGDWRDVEPKDGALVNYRNYLKEFYDAEENKKAC